MNEKIDIKDSFKFLLLAVPTLSLIMANIYYWVFFYHFDDLSTKLLSISDYFDKSADFFLPVLLVVFSVAAINYLMFIPLGMMKLFNRFLGKSNSQQGERRNRSFIGLALSILSMIAWTIWFVRDSVFIVGIITICIVWIIGPALISILPKPDLKNPRGVLGMIIIISTAIMLPLQISKVAVRDVLDVGNGEFRYLDTLSTGLLISEDGELVFKISNAEISRS